MEVTEADIAKIPRGNVRVPVPVFAVVWAAAERRCDGATRRREHDWYAAGVALTCQWLARVTVRPARGPWYPARAPVTGRSNLAYEELIQAEYIEAEKLDLRRPRPGWLARRPGWSEGICATLRWCWCRTGPPPLPVDDQATDPAAG